MEIRLRRSMVTCSGKKKANFDLYDCLCKSSGVQLNININSYVCAHTENHPNRYPIKNDSTQDFDIVKQL